MQIRERKSNRLKGCDYSSSGYYFVTICTKSREEYFGNVIDRKMKLNEYGHIVNQYWFDLPNHYENCQLDEFIVMPNHIHGIIVITNSKRNIPNVGTIHELSLRKTFRRNMLIPKIIGRFKMITAKSINGKCGLRDRPIWQRSFYDHIIHNEYELTRIREYIKNNPANWKNDRNNPENLF